jgi:hypothetical protein
MRRFGPRVLAFALIQAVVAVAVYWACWSQPAFRDRDYHAAWADKHGRLLAAPSPRLVLVGGSNVAFSILSPALGDALGLEPVNLGLDVDLGLEFMLRDAEAGLRAGDVVVLSPEYQLLWRDATNQSLLALLAARPGAVRFVGLAQVRRLLDAVLPFAGEASRCALGRLAGPVALPLYARDGFNRFGDFVGHHDLAPPGVDLDARRPPDRLDLEPAMRRLRGFAAACRTRGATVYYYYPPMLQAMFDRHRAAFEEIDARLRSGPGIPLLNHPSEATYPRSEIFDSGYHLTLEGARRHTARLAERLATHGRADPRRPPPAAPGARGAP